MGLRIDGMLLIGTENVFKHLQARSCGRLAVKSAMQEFYAPSCGWPHTSNEGPYSRRCKIFLLPAKTRQVGTMDQSSHAVVPSAGRRGFHDRQAPNPRGSRAVAPSIILEMQK
jgi:ribosomal protein L37E